MSNSLLTLMQVIKMSSFCSKCKRTHPSLRMESFRRQPRCDFRSTEGLLPMFFTILEEPPLLCLLVPIESGQCNTRAKTCPQMSLSNTVCGLKSRVMGEDSTAGQSPQLIFLTTFYCITSVFTKKLKFSFKGRLCLKM